MTPCTVSVVVATFGRPDALDRCLSSLARQTFEAAAFEVIVVDDGSRPPVKVTPTLSPGGTSVVLVRQANQGPAAARNRGISKARGALVAFIDDDCEADERWLAELVSALERSPGAAAGGTVMNALHGNACAQASQDLVSFLCAYYNADPSDARFLTSNNLAFPRLALIAAGGFNAEYQKAAAEDRELCHRWRRTGGRLLVVPEAIVRHSHRLTLRSFCRQHFTYGVGARQFRAALATHGARVRLEPPGFYWGLLTWPIRLRGIGGIREALLVALAQAANAAGFFYERARDRRTPVVSVPRASR